MKLEEIDIDYEEPKYKVDDSAEELAEDNHEFDYGDDTVGSEEAVSITELEFDLDKVGAKRKKPASKKTRETYFPKTALAKKPRQIFTCEQCKFESTNLRFLVRHKKIPHTFACTECKYKGATESDLESHLESSHNIDTNYEKDHAENTSVGDNYSCLECDFNTSNPKKLTAHESEHDQGEDVKKYNCSKCDFSTPTRKRLYVHRKEHLEGGVKEEDFEFSCEVCWKPFEFEEELKNHATKCIGIIKA